MKYYYTEINASTYSINYDNDFLGVVYTKTGPVTLTLPDIEAVGPILYTIVDEGMNASVNHITVKVADNSSDTIHGSQSQIIQNDGGNIQIYNNGKDCWYIL